MLIIGMIIPVLCILVIAAGFMTQGRFRTEPPRSGIWCDLFYSAGVSVTSPEVAWMFSFPLPSPQV